MLEAFNFIGQKKWSPRVMGCECLGGGEDNGFTEHCQGRKPVSQAFKEAEVTVQVDEGRAAGILLLPKSLGVRYGSRDSRGLRSWSRVRKDGGYRG